MTTFEIQHGDTPRNRFTIVANNLLRGSFPVPLRALERVLLLHFASLDSGMRMSRAKLDRAVEEGRDAVTKALTSLEDKGYLRRTRTRGAGGTWLYVWQVTMDPIKEPLPPLPDSPSTDSQSLEPSSGNTTKPQVAPCPENPCTVNQSISTEDCKSRKTREEDRSANTPTPLDNTQCGSPKNGDREIDDDYDDERTAHLAVRLSELSDDHKVRKLVAVWVAMAEERGVAPDETWRRAIGQKVRELLESGTEPREVLRMTRLDITSRKNLLLLAEPSPHYHREVA